MRDELKQWLTDWAGLKSLVENHEEESSQLDFKLVLFESSTVESPGNQASRKETQQEQTNKKERDAKERLALRKDVTAMGNSQGGALVIGIGEADSPPNSAGRLKPIPNLKHLESILQNTLRDRVEPPFAGNELRLKCIPNPDDPVSGAIVIWVPKHRPGKPWSVVVGERDELSFHFWVRQGTSNRRMSYSEIEALYHSDEEAAERRQIDAMARARILDIELALRGTRGGARAERLLGKLCVYSDNEYHFGESIKNAVVDAALVPLTYMPKKKPMSMVRLAIRLITNALPLHFADYPLGRSVEESELKMLERVGRVARDLIYVASRRTQDLELLSVGGSLLHDVLRFAHLNGLAELKNDLVEEFRERIEWAEKDNVPMGKPTLEWQLADALREVGNQEEADHPDGVPWWAVYGNEPDDPEDLEQIQSYLEKMK